jgi:DNA-binding CsgD family transcriptional regulator
MRRPPGLETDIHDTRRSPAVDKAPPEAVNHSGEEMKAVRALLVVAAALLPARGDGEHARDLTPEALVSDVVDLLGGTAAGPSRSRRREHNPLPEALSDRELRILRYLPTHLSAPEIANELYISLNTAKTHLRHIYTKLGVNSRKDAVEQARLLRLLAP